MKQDNRPLQSSEGKRPERVPSRLGVTAQVGWVTHLTCLWTRTEWSAYAGRSLRARSLPLLAILFVSACFTGPAIAGEPVGENAMSEAENRFMQRVIFRWQATDLARKWLDARLEKGAAAECDVMFFKADCFKAEANEDAFAEAFKKAKRRCPSHPKAQSGTLELMKAAMLKVIKQNQLAIRQPAGPKRNAAFKERDRLYDDLQQQLQRGIDQANETVKKNENQKTVQLRDNWEHYRVQAQKIWAGLVTVNRTEAEVKKAWEQVYDWASAFVDERWQNFVLQCEAQLFKSEALANLGRTEEAAEEYDLLVEMAPAVMPPYPPVIKAYLRELRLKAITGTAQAWNGVGRPAESFAVFERVAANPDPDVELEKASEDPTLIRFVVPAKIEEAIARCAAADDDSGIQLFLELIQQYGEKEIAPGEVSPHRLKVARGAARLLDLGCGLLPALVYEYAGIGFQVDGQYRKATFAYKRALREASRDTSKDGRAYSAKLLDLIGQTYYQAGRLYEAGASFHTIYEAFRRYGGSSAPEAHRVIAARASQNTYSIFSKLASESGTSAPWETLTELAQGVMVKHADLRLQIIVTRKEGADLEEAGDYAGARQKYLSVPMKDKSGKLMSGAVELRILAARALFLEKKATGDPQAGLAKALKELEDLGSDIRRAEVKTFAAFTTGELHWDETVRDTEKALAALEGIRSLREDAETERLQALRLWIEILVAEKKGKEADDVFGILKKEYAKSQYTLSTAADLIALHLELGSPYNKTQAGDIAAYYIDHPDAGMDAMAPSSLLFFGRALVDGGRVTEARQIMKQANDKAPEGDAGLSFAVKLLLAKVQIASGDFKECVKLLDELEKSDPAIREGSVPDAHTVYQLRADARLALYKKDPKADLLQKAARDTEIATGILQQSKDQPGAPPEIIRAYYEGHLSLLKIWKTQKEWEKVIKTVKTFDYMGALDSMPEDLSSEFKRLQAECEKKR